MLPLLAPWAIQGRGTLSHLTLWPQLLTESRTCPLHPGLVPCSPRGDSPTLLFLPYLPPSPLRPWCSPGGSRCRVGWEAMPGPRSPRGPGLGCGRCGRRVPSPPTVEPSSNRGPRRAGTRRRGRAGLPGSRRRVRTGGPRLPWGSMVSAPGRLPLPGPGVAALRAGSARSPFPGPPCAGRGWRAPDRSPPHRRNGVDSAGVGLAAAGMGFGTRRDAAGSPGMGLGLAGRGAGPVGKGLVQPGKALGLVGMGPVRPGKGLDQWERGWAGSGWKGRGRTDLGVGGKRALVRLGGLVQRDRADVARTGLEPGWSRAGSRGSVTAWGCGRCWGSEW